MISGDSYESLVVDITNTKQRKETYNRPGTDLVSRLGGGVGPFVVFNKFDIAKDVGNR